jgi:hypothetical protein
MTTMFVRHPVSNYEVWRKAYDDFAPAFLNSDELKNAMQGGGVVGAPTIWFTNKK